MKLKYEDNIVQLALERNKAGTKGSEYYDEEEAKRKFTEKGISICDHCTRDRCNQNRTQNACSKTHFKQVIKSHTFVKFGNCS
jgi:mRNA (2'-O-methyladenosine-N6-)-methyltransferase